MKYVNSPDNGILTMYIIIYSTVCADLDVRYIGINHYDLLLLLIINIIASLQIVISLPIMIQHVY